MFVFRSNKKEDYNFPKIFVHVLWIITLVFSHRLLWVFQMKNYKEYKYLINLLLTLRFGEVEQTKIMNLASDALDIIILQDRNNYEKWKAIF